jgi:hypothetical protein
MAKNKIERTEEDRQRGAMANQFLKWWAIQWKQNDEQGREYVFSYAKETVLVKKILIHRTPENLGLSAQSYLQDRSAWLRNRGHTIGMFFSVINEYPKKSNGHNSKQLSAGDIDESLEAARNYSATGR